jgi:hypothetical protein
MRRNLLTSRASLMKRGREGGEGQFPGQREQARLRTEPSAPGEPCHPKPGDGPGLVWLRAILCAFFLRRRFSRYDSGVEDAFHASPAPRRFAPANFEQGAASHPMSASRSRHRTEESDLPGPDSSPVLPRDRRELDLPWRTPWPYLSILLLVWLLLL